MTIIETENIKMVQYKQQGINRAQLTLQELQDLAERQRQQILYNSKELMEKQQQLMQMHHSFRSRLKVKDKDEDKNVNFYSPRNEQMISSPRPAKPMKPQNARIKSEQDQYAKMLRQTYQNMGKLQQKSQIQMESDIKKFNNIELAHELEKIRAIFKSKQKELAEAVKKVDVLTHELEQRKRGDPSYKDVPTPERINRRKKIQAAKDELDRLRNELVVRNEMNSQQSHQLQLQRDIIQEKQQELRQLNSRMNELGNALRKKHGGSNNSINFPAKPPSYLSSNGLPGGVFSNNYLQDTLSRKRSPNKHVTQDINGNTIPPRDISQLNSRSGSSTSGFESDDSRDSSRSEERRLKNPYENTPLNANLLYRNEPKSSNNIESRTNEKTSFSPASSLSSLSSNSSTAAEDKPPYAFGKDPPPPLPTRTTPIGVLINRNEPSQVKSAQSDFLSDLQKEQEKIQRLQNELYTNKTNKSNKSKNMNLYTDANLTNLTDKFSEKYKQYIDANNSSSEEKIPKNNNSNTGKTTIVVKPQILPKPVVQVKPLPQDNDKDDLDEPDKVVPNNNTDSDVVIVPSASALINGTKTIDDSNSNKDDLPMTPDSPTEPEEFELSFADIDTINETQTDIWSGSGSTLSQSSVDSESDDFDINVVPVLVSVPPESMPPPILMKPDKPRKPKRKLILDPFALLLDAALEGEMETVKESLRKVPDPSLPNPEGITALHNAVCGNHKDVVKFLVEVGCDINSADNNGWTPLHCAAFYNDTELCRFLVEHGASVFATTYTDYQTPAHKCSQLDENYDECFGYLHECKENVGRTEGGLVHTLYDYTAEGEDELSFPNGEMLTILRRGDNTEKEWWWARNRRGETGYIPCNYLGNFPRIAAEV